MHFVYIDDSGDEKTRCFSALFLHESVWKQSYAAVKEFRRSLKRSDAMFVTKELHATEFVAGRGRVGTQVVTKGRRCEIFRNALELVAALPKISLMNAVAPRHQEKQVFERLVNRINKAMAEWRSNALIIHDEGKDYSSLIRRMAVYNPIRSQYGQWPGGAKYKNIPTANILEDIVFRKSENPTSSKWPIFVRTSLPERVSLPSKTKYGLDRAFSILQPICKKAAFVRDPKRLGIIRCP